MNNQEIIIIRKNIKECLGKALIDTMKASNDRSQREEVARKLAEWNICNISQLPHVELERQILAILDEN